MTPGTTGGSGVSVADTWLDREQDTASVLAILAHFEVEDHLESLIPALHEIQEQYRYIPEGAARIISEYWHIPMTDIFGVVTFYSDFSTEPRGRNLLWVCEGAACYFMGGPQLGELAQRKLNIGYNETTEDGEWTVRRADFCFGACHLAPLVELNHEIVGPLSRDTLEEIIDNPPAHERSGG